MKHRRVKRGCSAFTNTSQRARIDISRVLDRVNVLAPSNHARPTSHLPSIFFLAATWTRRDQEDRLLAKKFLRHEGDDVIPVNYMFQFALRIQLRFDDRIDESMTFN